MVVDNYYGLKFKVVFWVPWWAVHRTGSHLASEVVLVEFTKPKRHGYWKAIRSGKLGIHKSAGVIFRLVG